MVLPQFIKSTIIGWFESFVNKAMKRVLSMMLEEDIKA